MFFYGYRCYMKKHDIANDAPNFLYDDKEDEFLGGLAQGDGIALGGGHASGGRHAPRGGPFAEDDS